MEPSAARRVLAAAARLRGALIVLIKPMLLLRGNRMSRDRNEERL
jgi:hypothetical protein